MSRVPAGRARAGARAALIVLLALCIGPSGTRADDTPVVAAAADLNAALSEIAANYSRERGARVRVTFGSSGNIARQIKSGAPIDIFLSADEDLVADLFRSGLTRDEGVLYGLGRLALVVLPGSPLKPDGSLDDLAAAIADGRLSKLAIANPEHAPYGRRAQEALEHRGLWAAVADRLVIGENVAQATQFALSGGAQAGLVAYAMLLSPDLAGRAAFALVPEDWHRPLRQRMVVMRGARPGATAFFDYLRSDAARSVLARYGFTEPQ